MDWSKTKTIFIAVFLVLDIFLAVMFFNKYSASRFEVIKTASIEDKLKEDGVTYEKLPADSGEMSRIVAKPKIFSEKDLLFLTKQQWDIREEGQKIVSTLDKPYDTEGAKREKLNSFVKNNVFQGGNYSYWGKSRNDDETATVTYYQKIEGEKLFKNAYGMLTLTLDEEENIIGYSQKVLESTEDNRNEEAILPALNAIDALYTNGLIQPGDKINDAELGYYTVEDLTESQSLQVLSPTWYFQLESGDITEEVYVNAFDGSIYQNEKES
ncbi:two-component system regulatory protein YycI [Domibacillus indicus]|uniref:two-component system regulatory protein YycI n=1 Tax=Domibacillus indicus TaxID=1437523 RepID=UPI000617FD54|nr:two-component system regulatory protein YycI [Domibacillus indicus]